MRAVVYHAERDFRVETVADPALEAADDAIVRVTTCAICGSDLHMYHGKVLGLKPGDILGHEFMGVVEEVGREVTRVKKGDRVVVPFVIACGQCYFCQKGLYSGCERTNPGPGGAINKKQLRPAAAFFGYSHLYGGVSGGQAEFVRVPHANVNPFKVPDGLEDEQVLFLGDILTTAYQAVAQAEVGPGSTVAIYGAGPVGLLCAEVARHKGARKIYLVDEEDYRTEFAAAQYGVTPLNYRDRDPAGFIVEDTDYRGVDAAIDAVGFEAKGSRIESALLELKLETSTGTAIRQCIAVTRRGGIVSIPGVYVGFMHAFLLGDAFDKGLTLRMGQTHVQKYLPGVLSLIELGHLRPQEIITHRMSLEDAAQGYDVFDRKREQCRKVVLKPGK